jgi:hypothetical protein
MRRCLLVSILLLAVFPSASALAEAAFDAVTRLLSLPLITAGDQQYRNVVLRLDDDGRWTVSSGPAEWLGSKGATAVSDTCGSEHITKERFGAVQLGMAFEDAIAAVGCRGELVAEGMDGEAQIKAYHFEHGDSNFDLWFKNGKVADKRQTIAETR